MIQKIISGGQTGADRAALDTAIKFNIEHGGWVPAGRKAEDGPIPEQYHMEEMPTDSYPKRTEQNIVTSDGTVIIGRGKLSGGSALTRKLAQKIKKPCLHIDLLEVDEFEAAVMINSFVSQYSIRVLNVAGPRESTAPGIFHSVKAVLETFVYMSIMENGPDDIENQDRILLERRTEKEAATLEEAVAFLKKDMHLKTRSFIANAKDFQIAGIYFSMADTIKVKLGLENGNKALLEDCARTMSLTNFDIEDAVMVIIKALKLSLEKDHVLRVVK